MAGDRRGIAARLSAAAARLGRRLRGVEPRSRVAIRCDRVAHAGWWICPQAIGAGDIVYSFETSGDLSFERALSAATGARVFAFDPDPATAARAEADPLPAGVRLHSVGVGGRDHRAEIPLPGGGVVETRVLRVSSHMRLLGHRRLDVIRLAVPSSVTDVLAELVGLDADVHQLLVGFGAEKSRAARDRIERAVQLLAAHGYRAFHISPDRTRFSFIRTDSAAL